MELAAGSLGKAMLYVPRRHHPKSMCPCLNVAIQEQILSMKLKGADVMRTVCILDEAKLCCTTVYRKILCYAMLCYAMLCYATLCYAVLYSKIFGETSDVLYSALLYSTPLYSTPLL